MEADHASSSPLDRRLAPLLLFGHGGDHGKFVYSLPRSELLRLPAGSVDDAMRGHRVWATAQGWLLMARRGSPETFLCDPFTGSRVGLPPDHDGTILTEGHRRLCLLSRRRPTDPGCVVLVVNLADAVLWYCRPGCANDDGSCAAGDHQQWVKHEYLQPGTLHHEHRASVLWAIGRLTAVRGKFYVDLFVHGHLAVLEFSPEPVFTVIATDDSARSETSQHTCSSGSLVELDGELYFVWFSHPTDCYRIVARVTVYKLDMAKGSAAWVKVNSLGGKVLFVEQNRSGASFDAKEAGLKALYVYDMERGTTAVAMHNPCPDNLPYHLLPSLMTMPTR